MSKMCPFMSINMSVIDVSDKTKLRGKSVSCVPSCALYYNGHCSINIIAQAQYKEFLQKNPAAEKKIPTDDRQQ